MDATSDVIVATREEWGESHATLSCADRRQHVYVLGKSGTGKTTLLRNLIVQDIEAGRGVGVIDPHGDLAADLLDLIPARRTEDVTYFDPSDSDYAVGFNLFARVPEERRHLVASGVVAAFKGIFPEFFGPRMEYIFHAAVAALLDCSNVSLLGLQRLLSDETYRHWVVRQVKDPVVRRFWTHEFESHDRRTKAEMVSPILNKVGPMLMAPPIRNVLGQVRNRIEARFMMDRGRIFIANVSKGRLGSEKAGLLGSFLVSQFQLAAMERVEIPEHARRDFFLYVDEFQSFTSGAFADILSEARKYRLCLTLSHQYLGQLRPGIEEAIIGNVGSIISFRIGHEDAEAMERAFGGAYSAAAFTSLSNGQAFMKLMSDGCDTTPFLARTRRPIGTAHRRGAIVIRRSREKYASRRKDVEATLRRWLATQR